MREINIYNKNDHVFLGKVKVADSFLKRTKGLLGSQALASFKGILLKPCKQVHTIGMLYPISIWYINQDLKIIKIIDELPPFSISPYVRNSHLIIEFPSTWAQITGSQEGDNLEAILNC